MTATATAVSPIAEQDAASALKRSVLDFVRDHLIGRTIESNVRYVADSGKMENEFSRKETFINLVETADGLTFDTVSHITQSLYDLDENGTRKGNGRRRERIFVARYEFQVQSSETPGTKLTGLMRPLTNSVPNWDVAGLFSPAIARVSAASLVIETKSGHPREQYAAGGKWRIGESEIVRTYSVSDDGQTVAREVENNYYVDASTGAREPISKPVVLEGRQVAVLEWDK